jgi:hypothetical protein
MDVLVNCYYVFFFCLFRERFERLMRIWRSYTKTREGKGKGGTEAIIIVRMLEPTYDWETRRPALFLHDDRPGEGEKGFCGKCGGGGGKGRWWAGRWRVWPVWCRLEAVDSGDQLRGYRVRVPAEGSIQLRGIRNPVPVRRLRGETTLPMDPSFFSSSWSVGWPLPLLFLIWKHL